MIKIHNLESDLILYVGRVSIGYVDEYGSVQLVIMTKTRRNERIANNWREDKGNKDN